MTEEHKGRWLAHIRPDLYPQSIQDAREYLLELEKERDQLDHDLRGAKNTANTALGLAERVDTELQALRKLFEEVQLERDGMKACVVRLVKYGSEGV